MKSNCPICNEDNNCEMSRGGKSESCWCMNVTIPSDVLETSPVNNRCICEKCIEEEKIRKEGS